MRLPLVAERHLIQQLRQFPPRGIRVALVVCGLEIGALPVGWWMQHGIGHLVQIIGHLVQNVRLDWRHHEDESRRIAGDFVRGGTCLILRKISGLTAQKAKAESSWKLETASLLMKLAVVCGFSIFIGEQIIISSVSSHFTRGESKKSTKNVYDARKSNCRSIQCVQCRGI